MRRILTTLSLTIVALFATASLAFAATTTQVINDAKDGVIDGKYTAAELRAADKAISPQQREYNDWDSIYSGAYAAALARARGNSSGGTGGTGGTTRPTPVKPVDTNGNNMIDPEEEAVAEEVNEELGVDEPVEDDVPADEPADVDGSGGKVKVDKVNSADLERDKEDGDALVVVLVLVVLAALLGVTIWRVMVNRRRNHGDPRAVRDEFTPENEGRDDIAHDARFHDERAGDTEVLPPVEAEPDVAPDAEPLDEPAPLDETLAEQDADEATDEKDEPTS